MYDNSLKYVFMKFLNWERKGNFEPLVTAIGHDYCVVLFM